jgi:hypothetical protein
VHPDFAKPTVVVASKDKGLVGIRVHQNVAELGRLYDGGQLRQYSGGEPRPAKVSSWQSLEGITLWARGCTLFPPDRDRGNVDWKLLIEALRFSVVPLLSKAQTEQLLMALSFVWQAFNVGDTIAARLVLVEVLDRAITRHRLQIQFDEKYVAYSVGYPYSMVAALESQGYVVCKSEFAKLGMTTMLDFYGGIGADRRVKPSEREVIQIQVLRDAIHLLNQQAHNKHFQPKEIWLYESGKSPIVGQYANQHVWLSKVILKAGFAVALAAYLHELDHAYGSDYSAEFSYALTTTLEIVVLAGCDNGDSLRRLQQRFLDA